MALAGCGGGGEGSSTSATDAAKAGHSGPSPELSPTGHRGPDRSRRRLSASDSTAGQVRDDVNAVLTSTDPRVCSPALVSEHYLEASYGGRQGCVSAQAPGSVADSLEFKGLRIEGSRATAVVVPSGGPYDGERITVSLVRDSHWAVDELHSNAPVGP